MRPKKFLFTLAAEEMFTFLILPLVRLEVDVEKTALTLSQ